METTTVKPPSRKELVTLRVMIVTGFICMGFFIYALFDQSVIGYAPLYWLLITTFVFTCLKIVHEWIHYFYITVPETPAHIKTYTVDIFTTFCAGEPYEMIAETLEAIQKITYPHKTYLCDEANDPYLKEVCKRLGVNHVTRAIKTDAKAGNINNALKHSSGELCVVLDPDHVPLPGFLDPIVSHFNNAEIGFVQIVQAYKNHNEGLIARGAAQQTYHFYGPMMMTMNKYGTVLAIGANCTFRRAALDSIGGHAAGLAEDMHTAMQLHAAGWKSVYVPAVLARGLVPSTLSAYFKQQLKWSRGVFELLVTSYPKLFKKFTWQQKLHYGIIPMHYLSGIIFLFNFLIPVASLLLNVSPMRIDLLTFGLIGFPMIAAIVIIRHYVQRWVMENDERGFHLVGGLLMMGTWWIFILGFFFTLIRKPVPYNPTPKDGNEANNWPLNIPNLVVLGISSIAIAVGLYIDSSPYTFFMAGLAGINCIIITFNIAISRQNEFRKHKERLGFITASMYYTTEVKKRYWIMRDWVYSGGRSTALLLSVVIVCLTFYCFSSIYESQPHVISEMNKKDFFLSGIFSPAKPDGLTSLKLVKDYGKRYKVHFDIVSFYIPWGDEDRCHVPAKLLDSVYKNGSIPMITWEPWQSLFSKPIQPGETKKEKKVLSYITKGAFDAYLTQFSGEIKSLNRPVFIRFAHEADNPFYPWSAKGGNTPEEFKNAWQYVHDFFIRNGADNAIWVWNPWKSEAVNAYFPGKDYIDWIGVTNLNYGAYDSSKKWLSMQQLYSSFHINPVFQSGLPVMLAEMGSLKSEGRQIEWFKNAFDSIKTKFPEIKATVLFNSGIDMNLPSGISGRHLDWQLANPDTVLAIINKNRGKTGNNKVPLLWKTGLTVSKPASSVSAAAQLFTGTKGVNYTKGQNWYENNHPFAKNEILKDFAEMKQNGIKAVKINGSVHYARKLIEAADEMDMKVYYEYRVPEINFTADKEELNNVTKSILKMVNGLKKYEKIAGWNIGNAVLQKLYYYYYKPELLYHQEAYIAWLRKLVLEIKKADPARPVTIDAEVDDNLIAVTNLLHIRIPEIDSYGLILNEKSTGVKNIARLKVPYFFSKADAGAYLNLPATNAGAFMADWQDQDEKNVVTFDGLKDNKGRYKFSFCQLRHRWAGWPSTAAMPKIKILRPAIPVLPDIDLTYYALAEKNNEWLLADSARTNLTFRWYLVKDDIFGNGVFMKEIGEGKNITFRVHDNPSAYRLYLTAAGKENITTGTLATLNTPLE